MNLKIKWLRDKLSLLNIQGMIISNPVNIRYLTGIDTEGELIITRKENLYITDSRYIEAVNSVITVNDDVVVCDRRELTLSDYENMFIFCENVGFEEKYVTYEEYKTFMHIYKANNLVETEGIIEKQRTIKDEEEVDNIKRACKLTDECFKYLLTYIKKGMTEKEIAFEIERFFYKNGADEISFKPIVATGKNSSMPHWLPSEKKVESGDTILLDFGCKINGYCSDMTRTIFMDNMNEWQKKVYDLVLKNQKISLQEYKDGSNIKLISKMIQSDLKLNGFETLHALGHGLGLDIHEKPFITVNTEQILKEHMIVTSEPGVYIAGNFGIRIEDTVLIEKNGSITLTNSEKNYIII